MKIETLAVRSGTERELDENDPIVAPIVLGTVFERGTDTKFKHGLVYSRAQNPNRTALESALARLEGGKAAAAFASGSAATLAVLQSLKPGDHVIATAGFYGTTKLLTETMAEWGLRSSMVDTTDVDAVRNSLTPQTRLVWAETPSNPMMKVSDIRALAEVTHAAGALLFCDNTLATPLLQCCFDLGADFVMHSTTKYLGGHSDVIGGAVVAREDDELFKRIRTTQTVGGAVPSPFDCWLLLRGMKTLALRVPRQAESALRIAEHFSKHPKVERVLYAGLKSHPGHEIAARQMSGFGGLLSILVKGDRQKALDAMSRVKLIVRATSLGGVETSIDHRESVEPPGAGAPANLLRISVGIEHVDDLIEDLEQAL